MGTSMADRVRDRHRQPRPLGEAVARFRRDMAPPTLLASVQTSWAQAVGESIAGQATPVSDRDGVITVRCRSAVWAAELTMLAEELGRQVNEALSGGPQLKALRFTTGAG
jgi:predicted nucleic acid-binding Zn ribbon protein